jgi:hypothetical protein
MPDSFKLDKLLLDFFSENDLKIIFDKCNTYSDKVIIASSNELYFEICCDIGNKVSLSNLCTGESISKDELISYLKKGSKGSFCQMELDI